MFTELRSFQSVSCYTHSILSPFQKFPVFIVELKILQEAKFWSKL